MPVLSVDPIGEKPESWLEIGGKGKIGPFNQGFSGLHTNAREHARFCYLGALRAGRRVTTFYFNDRNRVARLALGFVVD